MIDQRYRDLAGAAEDAARPPEFAAVRHRGARLRTRRRAGGALAAAVLVASSVAGVVALRPAGGETWDVAAGGRRMVSSGAADAQHLYASVADCMTCPAELLASDDGGRTWERRTLSGPAPGLPMLTVLGPEILLENRLLSVGDVLASRPPRNGSTPSPWSPPEPGRAVSLDGGRTWRDVAVADTPVAAAAAGTRAVNCQVLGVESALGECDVYAVDPASGRFAPLAEQPPVDFPEVVDVPAGAGLWVIGADPATDRAAVAVSRNGGRTWDKWIFDAEPPVVERQDHGLKSKLHSLALATTDGELAYASFIGAGPVGIYRTTDGGKSWVETRPGSPMSAPLAGPNSIVTTDGMHVLPALDGSGFQYLGSADGRSYKRVDLPGLPALGNAPRAVTGRFFLFQSSEDGLFASTDGRHWRRLPLD